MRYRVIETLTTPLHRFVAGMEIDQSEIDGLIPAKRWAELGKLAPVEAEPMMDAMPIQTEIIVGENSPPEDAEAAPRRPRRS